MYVQYDIGELPGLGLPVSIYGWTSEAAFHRPRPDLHQTTIAILCPERLPSIRAAAEVACPDSVETGGFGAVRLAMFAILLLTTKWSWASYDCTFACVCHSMHRVRLPDHFLELP